MNTLNIDRLTATLSDILSAKYSRQIVVTFKEGEQDDYNNPDCPGTDSCRSAQLHPLHDAV